MESKRKSSEEGSGIAKKAKTMENCPHAEKCYRRNPHHFKEYSHPHLDNLLKQGDDFILPDNFPQSRQVVTEQLTVLKELRISLTCKASISSEKCTINLEKSNSSINISNTLFPSKNTSSSKNTPSSSNNTPSSSNIAPSSSKNVSNTRIKLEKKTVFVPGKLTYQYKNSMAEKLENNSPYNLFFTTIPDAYETLDHPNSITFADLVCPSLGQLKSSLQLNFMIDVSWLIEQYEVHKVHKKPLTVVYGYEFPGMTAYMDKLLPNVKYHQMKMKDPFGIHHSKVGIYSYEDGSIRVVVSTANLYYEDWNHYNQGLWVSPACPRLAEGTPDSGGESPTAFKSSLIKYLQTYQLPILQEWINLVKRADFRSVKVFLVTSVPGKHYPNEVDCHLYRIEDLLTRHCKLPEKKPDDNGPLGWQVNVQASSIGSLGKAPGDWLRSVLLRSLACRQQATPSSNPNATINVIFPTVKNVMTSYYGAQGGGCLPYAKNVHQKQTWLQDYMHEWSADGTSRSKAMPHIKTYCRISPCKTKLAWFLLTSANISKAAWGGNIQKDGGIYVRSYEVGVLWLPKFFDQDHFPITKKTEHAKFPFIYDRELKKYKEDDYPWCN